MPESVDRAGGDAVLERPGVSAGGEDEPSAELVAEELSELTQTGEVRVGRLRSCLDFEADDAAVVGLDEHIDFVVVMSAPVGNIADNLVPRRLLEELADDEGFEEVSELGGRGRIRASLAGVRRSMCAARPASTRWSFGVLATRDLSVRPHAGSRRTRNKSVSSCA